MPNAEHLFDQADRLAAGGARQADIRRAISAAYYGIFHFVATAAADAVIGRARRATPRYALAYRSIDHRSLRDVCAEASKPNPSAKFRPFLPDAGFGSEIRAFADATAGAQLRRHAADYDPMGRFAASEARAAAADARRAAKLFDADQRATFLALLLFPPR